MVTVITCLGPFMMETTHLTGPGVAAAVLIIAKYLYQSAFVADQEINTLACLTEIMVESDFK